MTKTGAMRATLAVTCTMTLIGAGMMLSPAHAQQNPSSGQPFSGGNKLSPLELPPLPKKEYPKEKFEDWTRQCETRPGVTQQRCFLTQTVVQTRNDQKLALLGITVGHFGPEKKLGIIFRVPLALGVFLPSGFKYNVPGLNPTPIAIQFCLPKGCSATSPLTPDLIAAMKKANAGTLEVQTLNKRVIRLPVSFKGFTKAFASLN